MDVSVIVPVYNAEQHLDKCIVSICNQTLRNIEILCIDDGSTDGSLKILTRLAANDSRIRILHQENAGAGAARNAGLREARGRYLSFLDADDFFEPDMLKEAYYKALEDDADFVVFSSDLYNENTGNTIRCTRADRKGIFPCKRPFAVTEIKENIFMTVVGWAWDKLFKTEFIRNNNLWFQEQRTSNDLLFVYSALVKANRITTVSKVLVHQRIGVEGSLSVTREKSWMCFYNALLELRKFLKQQNLYERFEQDYINYALHFSLWNLRTLKEPIKIILYNKLRTDWFRELGITEYPKEKFFNKRDYIKYKLIMKIPYNKYLLLLFVFRRRLKTYQKSIRAIIMTRY